MFHDGDLQSGIASALQQSKAVLCFVQDRSETSRQWEDILSESPIATAVTAHTVALRLDAGSQEAGFLTPICPINSTPAIVVIKYESSALDASSHADRERNAQVQHNLQSAEVSVADLKGRLEAAFDIQDAAAGVTGSDAAVSSDEQKPESAPEYLHLQPGAPGQMRLPNNAYDALRNHTQKMLDDGISPSEVFQTQLSLLNNIPIFHDEVKRLRSSGPPELSEYARSRLLRLPAVGLRIPGVAQPSSAPPAQARQQEAVHLSSPAPSTPISSGNAVPPARPQTETASPSPDNPTSEKQKAQRTEYIKMQREREQKQRDERERIKAQIKADREERRRLDELRKQGEIGQASASANSSGQSRSRSTEVRVQVRTFDGSTLRSTFQPSSTLSRDIRPWIDSNSNSTVPYNLKLILTPLPNRNIEAAEEEQELSALGVVGSCTLVMVPVKGYVESYTGSTSGGLLGAAVSGGYNLVSGTAGLVFGGVKSLLGYNQDNNTTSSTLSSSARGQDGQDPTPPNTAKNVRVRTLADQRAEEAKRDQQFYNGNQLNFEPNKDEDKKD